MFSVWTCIPSVCDVHPDARSVSSSSSSVMNDEQSQEVEALAAIMGDDMWTDAEQPGSHCFFISPQCDSETEVCCGQS